MGHGSPPANWNARVIIDMLDLHISKIIFQGACTDNRFFAGDETGYQALGQGGCCSLDKPGNKVRHHSGYNLWQCLPKDIGTHSLRIGGASALWNTFRDTALVQRWGRWTSSAFQSYFWAHDRHGLHPHMRRRGR